MIPTRRHPRRVSLPALRLTGGLALALALLAPAAPVQASEVVKLARLVITGKRQPSKPPAPATPTDRTDPAPGPQSRSTDGEHHASTTRRSPEAAIILTE